MKGFWNVQFSAVVKFVPEEMCDNLTFSLLIFGVERFSNMDPSPDFFGFLPVAPLWYESYSVSH